MTIYYVNCVMLTSQLSSGANHPPNTIYRFILYSSSQNIGFARKLANPIFCANKLTSFLLQEKFHRLSRFLPETSPAAQAAPIIPTPRKSMPIVSVPKNIRLININVTTTAPPVSIDMIILPRPTLSAAIRLPMNTVMISPIIKITPAICSPIVSCETSRASIIVNNNMKIKHNIARIIIILLALAHSIFLIPILPFQQYYIHHLFSIGQKEEGHIRPS